MSKNNEAFKLIVNNEMYLRNPFVYIHNQLKDASSMAVNMELSETERQSARRKRKLLLTVVEYIREGAWCDTLWGMWEDVTERELECMYSLATKGFDKTCEDMKVSHKELAKLVHANANAVHHSIGLEFANMLDRDDIEAAEKEFDIKVNDSVKPFAEYIRKLLPESENVTKFAFVNLEDMGKELQFLHRYCSGRIRQYIRSLNKRHLRMLLYILESEDSRYTAEQELITSFLSKSECDVDGLLHELQRLQ